MVSICQWTVFWQPFEALVKQIDVLVFLLCVKMSRCFVVTRVVELFFALFITHIITIICELVKGTTVFMLW